MELLPAWEQQELCVHESTIERGLQTYIDVGNALLSIRNKRLYRQHYGTFEGYCGERWNMARNYANKLIASAEVATNLGTIVPILPATESQARPLTKLPPPNTACRLATGYRHSAQWQDHRSPR